MQFERENQTYEKFINLTHLNILKNQINHTIQDKVFHVQKDRDRRISYHFNDDEIRDLISKRRLTFMIPIKYYNSWYNDVRFDAVMMSVGYMKPSTLQNSVRSMLNTNSSIGQAFDQYRKSYKSVDHAVKKVHDVFLNIKVYDFFNTIFDNNIYQSIDEILYRYQLEHKMKLNDQYDLYKVDKKDVIVLNEPIDLTNEFRNFERAMSRYENISNDEEYHRHFSEFYNGLLKTLVFYTVMGDLDATKFLNIRKIIATEAYDFAHNNIRDIINDRNLLNNRYVQSIIIDSIKNEPKHYDDAFLKLRRSLNSRVHFDSDEVQGQFITQFFNIHKINVSSSFK